MKTVIHVWTHRAPNCPGGSWGIGDLLRGSYGLFNLSKKMNFNFIVDVSQHAVSKCLEVKQHQYSNLIEENKDNIMFIPGYNNIMNYIHQTFENSKEKEKEKDNVVYFNTNYELSAYDIPPTRELIDFMKELLTPTLGFSIEIQHTINTIKIKPYSIIHYRLGDTFLIFNSQQFSKFEYYEKHLRMKHETTDILLCDSEQFKKYVRGMQKEGDHIEMFDLPICHTGYHTKVDDIKDTMIEFFVMTQASKIKSYSVHGWISGFAYIIHKIYEIPFEHQIHLG